MPTVKAGPPVVGWGRAGKLVENNVMAMILAAIWAGLTAFAVCLFAGRIGAWLGVLDAPDGQRKIHPEPTPLIGGLAVIGPTLAVIAWLAATTAFTPLYAGLGAATVACFLLGLKDDRRHIRPMVRLALSILFAGAVFWLVPALQVDFLNFTFLRYALFMGGVTWVFSVLCLVGLQNAINMADGKNGVAIGLALFWTAEIAIFAPAHMYPLLLALATGLAVTLWFNLRGRLFLGDSGTYAMSYLFGLLVVYVYDVAFARLPADLVALWFLIPVVDCLRLMGRRIMRGRSPFSSDREHLHHILYDRMPWRWGLMVYLAMAGVPGLLASFWPATAPLWAAVSLCLYAVVLAWPARLRGRSGQMAR
jgi:UDP-GlcNAc:undecaprenyl-phosphate GlcNAc-1-phosphate transferase